jgi:hypothetical protein
MLPTHYDDATTADNEREEEEEKHNRPLVFVLGPSPLVSILRILLFVVIRSVFCEVKILSL